MACPNQLAHDAVVNTIVIHPDAVIICLRTQFLLDILFDSPHNLGIRDNNLAGGDIRALLIMSFQKLRLAPGNSIESIFRSHVNCGFVLCMLPGIYTGQARTNGMNRTHSESRLAHGKGFRRARTFLRSALSAPDDTSYCHSSHDHFAGAGRKLPPADWRLCILPGRNFYIGTGHIYVIPLFSMFENPIHKRMLFRGDPVL